VNNGLWLRLGLGILAIAAMVVGVWALFAPQSFYDDFPGGGRQWVSALPPYNEHLTRDVGELNLALAVLLGAAAFTLQRVLVVVALLAYLANSVPHFVFHVFNLEGQETVDQAGNALSLGFAVVLPLAMLALVWSERRREEA
jgi:hypothetical protein